MSLLLISRYILGQFDGHFHDFLKFGHWATHICFFIEFSEESENQLENTGFLSENTFFIVFY